MPDGTDSTDTHLPHPKSSARSAAHTLPSFQTLQKKQGERAGCENWDRRRKGTASDAVTPHSISSLHSIKSILSTLS
eukprot:2115690-Rhodomonas_salina.1